MSERPTISDTKRSFHACCDRVIAPAYRQVVDELLVELNLLLFQKRFHQDAVFATGLCQTFDSFMHGYRPETQKEEIFQAICSALGLDAVAIRAEVAQAHASVADQLREGVRQWSGSNPRTPAVVRQFLERVQQPGFHYNRLQAVGLMTLVEVAVGIDPEDATSAAKAAKQLAADVGLAQERFGKDVDLYRANLEKMAQGLEAMEEAVAAEQRRRQRQREEKEQGSGATSAAAPGQSPDDADSGPLEATPSGSSG
ncbi:MAG: photosystem II biogenesis protein Psp29 [Synechococcus sp. SB0668_bin_15]|nr:photosystem II biogenesis protein Psp29 [Synechococcus sp. SB0668_bin_15]MXZ82931.1 photosystem II biogenesis protein Psp29 [Synechococcus sp. SB0666_bin_14]MYA91232.1 photosystem II biogenesis protein Psp29 [Synechococcus sp. SB0663_bin_10]MYC49526.1 photosystem II biogenesis protein Psp29 [Synechococcus sp. SB0662_bin_14]MYG45999.1 photosystem II biogenesis protein Psp29 [Synechococcus sp. SB0675_bin_6]MYJ60268.1 photosystem II biogenesis protein Psp29 [Synechococcus sp. SB0672_bin_6]MYK